MRGRHIQAAHLPLRARPTSKTAYIHARVHQKADLRRHKSRSGLGSGPKRFSYSVSFRFRSNNNILLNARVQQCYTRGHTLHKAAGDEFNSSPKTFSPHPKTTWKLVFLQLAALPAAGVPTGFYANVGCTWKLELLPHKSCVAFRRRFISHEYDSRIERYICIVCFRRFQE